MYRFVEAYQPEFWCSKELKFSWPMFASFLQFSSSTLYRIGHIQGPKRTVPFELLGMQHDVPD